MTISNKANVQRIVVTINAGEPVLYTNGHVVIDGSLTIVTKIQNLIPSNSFHIIFSAKLVDVLGTAPSESQ